MSSAVSNMAAFLEVNAILLSTINIIFTFVGIFLNSVVIMSLLNTERRRKLCYFMIFILACIDLVVVFIFHPLIALETISMWWFKTQFYSVELWYLIGHVFVLSLTTLLTLTLERYLALVHPFYHEKSMTKLKLTAAICLMQLPFVILYFAFLTQIQTIYIELSILTLAAVVFFAIIFLNYKIYSIVEALRQREVIILGNVNSSASENFHVTKHNFSLGKVSTCLLAVVCLCVCYCPAVIVCVLQLTGLTDLRDRRGYLYLWLDTLVTLNSSFNCVIFFYKNSTLRRHGIRIMAKCFCGGRRNGLA